MINNETTERLRNVSSEDYYNKDLWDVSELMKILMEYKEHDENYHLSVIKPVMYALKNHSLVGNLLPYEDELIDICRYWRSNYTGKAITIDEYKLDTTYCHDVDGSVYYWVVYTFSKSFRDGTDNKFSDKWMYYLLGELKTPHPQMEFLRQVIKVFDDFPDVYKNGKCTESKWQQYKDHIVSSLIPYLDHDDESVKRATFESVIHYGEEVTEFLYPLVPLLVRNIGDVFWKINVYSARALWYLANPTQYPHLVDEINKSVPDLIGMLKKHDNKHCMFYGARLWGRMEIIEGFVEICRIMKLHCQEPKWKELDVVVDIVKDFMDINFQKIDIFIKYLYTQNKFDRILIILELMRHSIIDINYSWTVMIELLRERKIEDFEVNFEASNGYRYLLAHRFQDTEVKKLDEVDKIDFISRLSEFMLESTEPDYVVRRKIVVIVGDLSHENAIPFLTESLKDIDPTVRRATVIALMKINTLDSKNLAVSYVPNLIKDVRSSDPVTKFNAVRTLAFMGEVAVDASHVLIEEFEKGELSQNTHDYHKWLVVAMKSITPESLKVL